VEGKRKEKEKKEREKEEQGGRHTGVGVDGCFAIFIL
jgi:hypothetical protein